VRALWGVVAVVGVVAAPAAADVHDLQHWNAIAIQGRVLAPGVTTSPLLYTMDGQARVSLGGNPHFAMLRGALGWQLAKNLSVWGGAAAIPRYEGLQWHVNEARLWQQLLLTDRFDALGVIYRVRLEERSFEGAPEISVRARAMFRATYGIGETPWALVGWDEPFVGLLGPASRLGFDQNRAFVGVMHKIAPWLSVEGGYMWVYVGGSPEREARHLHTVMVQTMANLL
jgi:hypothetical protein